MALCAPLGRRGGGTEFLFLGVSCGGLTCAWALGSRGQCEHVAAGQGVLGPARVARACFSFRPEASVCAQPGPHAEATAAPSCLWTLRCGWGPSSVPEAGVAGGWSFFLSGPDFFFCSWDCGLYLRIVQGRPVGPGDWPAPESHLWGSASFHEATSSIP